MLYSSSGRAYDFVQCDWMLCGAVVVADSAVNCPFRREFLPVLARENVHKRAAARAGRGTVGARRVRSCLLSCSFSWTRLVSVSGRARMSLSPEQHSG